MITILIRTILVYLILIIAMRLMGKRQIGELEITDLVTTLLISEIASLPITDNNIPVMHAVIPIITVLTFEVLSSWLTTRYPRIKNLLTARPSTLIRNGKFCRKAMRDARISMDELISELRQKNVTDPSEVLYAILEQNGKITVIPKVKYRSPSLEDLNIKKKETGLFHIVVERGVVSEHSLSDLDMTREGLDRLLEKKGLCVHDLFLLLMNDAGETQIIKKGENQ